MNYKLLTTNYRKGFTLVELLIYIGIFSILLTVLTQVFVSIVNVGLEQEASSSVEEDSRFILTRLIHDVNNAQSIVSPALGAQSTSLQIIKDGENYTYSQNAGNMQLANNSGINFLNSFDTTISNLTFKRIGNVGGKHTVQVGFTITSKTVQKKGPEVKNIRTTVGIR